MEKRFPNRYEHALFILEKTSGREYADAYRAALAEADRIAGRNDDQRFEAGGAVMTIEELRELDLENPENVRNREEFIKAIEAMPGAVLFVQTKLKDAPAGEMGRDYPPGD